MSIIIFHFHRRRHSKLIEKVWCCAFVKKQRDSDAIQRCDVIVKKMLSRDVM